MTGPQGTGSDASIERLCRLAEVSRASYYRHWQASAPRVEEMGLKDAIQRLALPQRRYGYRQIAAHLRRQGWQANHKRVLRLMREDNLLCLRTKTFVPATTDSRHGWRVVPNLARGMELTGIDQLWVADITYVHLAEEFAYLAIILDAFSRKVIGWALDGHLRAELAIKALEMAIAARRPAPASLIHHSDRGSQYCSHGFQALLSRYGMLASMSGTGNCFDNAPMESFWHSLKVERVHGAGYETRAQAKHDVFSYIEMFYNVERRHSSLGYLSPRAFEKRYWSAQNESVRSGTE